MQFIFCANVVSDIAIFVLKRDVKLQLTNFCANDNLFVGIEIDCCMMGSSQLVVEIYFVVGISSFHCVSKLWKMPLCCCSHLIVFYAWGSCATPEWWRQSGYAVLAIPYDISSLILWIAIGYWYEVSGRLILRTVTQRHWRYVRWSSEKVISRWEERKCFWR